MKDKDQLARLYIENWINSVNTSFDFVNISSVENVVKGVLRTISIFSLNEEMQKIYGSKNLEFELVMALTIKGTVYGTLKSLIEFDLLTTYTVASISGMRYIIGDEVKERINTNILAGVGLGFKDFYSDSYKYNGGLSECIEEKIYRIFRKNRP